jgi:hypothetical protein
VWDVFARGTDTTKLSDWLRQHAAKFSHCGRVLQPTDPDLQHPLGPISSQAFELNQTHRDALRAATGGECFLGS